MYQFFQVERIVWNHIKPFKRVQISSAWYFKKEILNSFSKRKRLPKIEWKQKNLPLTRFFTISILVILLKTKNNGARDLWYSPFVIHTIFKKKFHHLYRLQKEFSKKRKCIIFSKFSFYHFYTCLTFCISKYLLSIYRFIFVESFSMIDSINYTRYLYVYYVIKVKAQVTYYEKRRISLGYYFSVHINCDF